VNAVSIALVSSLVPFASDASDFELLSNGGFESGNLSGWIESVGANEGHVVSISGVTAQPCARIEPNVPRSGSFRFSSSTQDGASPGTPEITISQVLDVSSFSGIPNGGATFVAYGHFSGAAGCSSTSDDTAQITVSFYSGGPSGTLVGSLASSPIDPFGGTWNLINLDGAVPQATDTIVFSAVTRLDPGFSSIDIGADDLSLVLSVPDVVPSIGPLQYLVLSVVLIAAARFRSRSSPGR
jgi:hypothetical protein